VFFVSTLALAYFGTSQPRSASSVLEGATVPAAGQIPGSAPAPAEGAGQIPAPATAPGPAQIPAK
jgi:preprotein translocase subunit SecG